MKQVEMYDSSGGYIRTCFKKQEIIPKRCGFVNPQRAALGGSGWVSQPVGRGDLAPTKPSPPINRDASTYH